MINSIKNNASGEAGVHVEGWQAETTKQNKALDCGSHHINKFVLEIRHAGLGLRSTAVDTQKATLLKLLEYLGSRGLNTYEGAAVGYIRIAARIKELKETHDILSWRENVVGPDRLLHKGVARYILVGKRQDPQPSLLHPNS